MKIAQDDSTLNSLLSSFSCPMDKDIESFFLNRAVEFESLSKARTYLVCDADQLKNGTKPLKIYAYFSLALKVLSVPDETSNRIRKDLDGYNAKIHGSPIRDFPCYLIGQLSKNYNINQNPLSGKDLLQFAYDIIATSVSAVGGRYIMIECKNNGSCTNLVGFDISCISPAA